MVSDLSPGQTTEDVAGDGWALMRGDSCERLAGVADDSVGLSVYSPPFASLYVYSPSPRDLGNSATRSQFLEHYGYVIREVLRTTAPGRLSAVHVQQLAQTKATDGQIGLTDFRGQVIQAHVDNGWIFHGEVTVDKDPQQQAVRTKSHALMFVTLERDSCGSRPALADYLLLFRKPGENRTPIDPECDRSTWIEWARPIWTGIREAATLNTALAKCERDERHITALQLPLIERCIRLWSNRGETVLSPFAGIGSEGYEAIRRNRSFIGCELKPEYHQVASRNLAEAQRLRDQPRLMSE
jgi:hypothetical protein